MDKYYTPKRLAESIVDSLEDLDPSLAADFAVGEGSLVEAIRRRWPRCKILATDVDRRAIAKLRQKMTRTSAGLCDFFNARSRICSPVLRRHLNKVPLIFLNPPFSSRGDKIEIEFEGKVLRCSRALAFIAISLSYLSSEGRLIALLPSSCLTSEKDAEALAEISRSYIVKVVPTKEPAQFADCSVDIAVVQFRRRKARVKNASGARVYKLALANQLRLEVAVARGRVSMPTALLSATKGGWPLVHTTSLRQGGVIFDQGTVSRKIKSTVGPAILISRVGRPTPEKICLYCAPQPIVISECVIAIRASTLEETKKLYELMQDQSRLLVQCYVGSCAKYLTLSRLTEFLSALGVDVATSDQMNVRVVKAA